MKAKYRNRIFDEYTLEEAKFLGIAYRTDWRNAQKGDWIRTADGKVLEVMNRIEGATYQYKSSLKPVKRADVIQTGYGKTYVYAPKILAQPSYLHRDGKDPVKAMSATEKQMLYLTRLIEYGSIAPDGMFDDNSIINSYMAVYSQNNPKSALLRGRGILKHKWAKKIMSEQMKDKLALAGLTDDWVVNQYKELGENDETPAATRLNAVNRVSELLGHNAKKVEGEQKMVLMLSDGDKTALAAQQKLLSDKELDALINTGEINGYLKSKSAKK